MSDFRYFSFTPVDSWFFRDGRPFHQGEATSDVGGLFPPSAFTVVGAIRAHLARRMGWRDGRWDDRISRLLGDGYDLGCLRFRGPLLCREKNSGMELLFPAPLNLYGKNTGKEMRLLFPGAEVECDLGRVRLPSAEGIDGMKPLPGYISAGQLASLLRGEVPGEPVIRSDELWETEYAVGLERDDSTRTAKEAHLYSINRIRLRRGVHLVMGIRGVDDRIDSLDLDSLDGAVVPMGGEGRMAHVREIDIPGDGVSGAEHIGDADGRIRFTLVHITPAFLERWPGPGESIPGVPGSVVSACLDRARRIGGWDSVRRRPVDLRPFIPPGSVWFCEAGEGELKEHFSRIGEFTGFGFGEVAVGLWRE